MTIFHSNRTRRLAASSRIRAVVLGLTLTFSACPSMADTPILFIHGNGDTAAVWATTLWRFESNGYDRKRLYTLDLPYPLSRDDDAKPQLARSSIAEYTQAVADKVAAVLRETGESKLVLIGNSRGGYPIRNYVQFGGGDKTVSKIILGGVPNHGVWANATNPGSEFNGSGAFLTKLNTPIGPDGNETVAGVATMTLRSDRFDKYAQPTGIWIGRPEEQTNIGFDGPALKGAENVVLPGRDHREVSFHPEAFNATYRFITGKAPARTEIIAEKDVTLDGQVSQLAGSVGTNVPLTGARVEVYEVNPATGIRIAQRHAKVVAADGRWGPFAASPTAAYEFVISEPGYAVTHIYRSPFPRSSDIINLRPAHIADADKDAGSIITMTRPRGYFGVGRDKFSFDGRNPPPGLPPFFPGVSASKIKLAAAEPRSVVAEFNGEKIVVQSWPAKDNHIVFAELHY